MLSGVVPRDAVSASTSTSRGHLPVLIFSVPGSFFTGFGGGTGWGAGAGAGGSSGGISTMNGGGGGGGGALRRVHHQSPPAASAETTSAPVTISIHRERCSGIVGMRRSRSVELRVG